MHGANRLGGNSLSDLLVFGKRAGEYAAEYAKGVGEKPPLPAQGDITHASEVALAPFRSAAGGEEPVHRPPGASRGYAGPCGHNPGRGRTQRRAPRRSPSLRTQAAAVSVEGNRQYNPGWHLALDLRNMILVAEAVALAALERQESRQEAHPRKVPDAARPVLGRAQCGG